MMPVYEDTLACRILLQELETLCGHDCFVVMVDDGSRLQPLSAQTFLGTLQPGKILRLQRNVGHQHALAVGLHYITGFIQPHQKLVLMDSDGEDTPQAIRGLCERLSEGVDAVVATRGKRQERLGFIMFYRAYKMLFRLATGQVC
ncbi:hypothetical protein GCM10027082_26660 [Comamonas humi]